MSTQSSIRDVIEAHGRIVLAEMQRGVEFVQERLSGVSWEHIALAAETTVEDVRASATRAFWGVEPTPA